MTITREHTDLVHDACCELIAATTTAAEATEIARLRDAISLGDAQTAIDIADTLPGHPAMVWIWRAIAKLQQ